MFERVLVGVDGLQGGRDAIALAWLLAAPGGKLTLAHIYGTGVLPGRGADMLLVNQYAAAQELLEQRREECAPDAELAVRFERSVGRGVHELASSRDADLLVVGSRHRGPLGRVLLGDDTSESLNGAPCAVAVAPTGYATSKPVLERIGVGVDRSPESDSALAVAREFAAREGSRVRARAVVSLHSVPNGEAIPDDWPKLAGQLVIEEERRLSALEGVEGEATYGDPAEELVAFSRELDLLVVGSRSYGPLGRLFNGSTSNYLAQRGSCPLLVLPRSAKSADE